MQDKDQKTSQTPAHVETAARARFDQPAVVPANPVKPDADVKLWMVYRECRLQHFIASR